MDCVLGRDRLLSWWNKARSKLSRDVCGKDFNMECKKPQICLPERLALLDSLEVVSDRDGLLETPFKPLCLPAVCSLCANCKRLLSQRYENLRSEGWVNLPLFFGLPDWKDLKNGI